MTCRRTVIGKVFKSKKWAKRWAKGRLVRKVKKGWKIYRKKRR